MTETTERASTPLTAARSAVRETGASLKSVFHNPNLRRVQLALAGSMIGDWAYATAVAVWAYRVGGMEQLRAIAIFAPLSPSVLETLARRLTPVVLAPGEAVIREGEVSDRFYLIASGLVEVTQAEAVLRREGPGDFFGEIGLLRDVPRTATVTAVEHTELFALEREDFLEAVTGHTEARSAAEDVVTRRLSL